MNSQDLSTRGLLAKLTMNAWSARKYDRKITEETNRTHGATSDAGRYTKHLMPSDAATYKALHSHISALRLTHYGQTLPWSDEGWRLLPVKNYQAYTDLLRAGQHTFNNLKSAFLADYPALKDAARVRLNGMFNEDDYPSDLEGKYTIEIAYAPVPVASDFRVTLTDEEIAIIAARSEERVRAAFESAQLDAVNRLFEVLSRIRERLTTQNVCSNCNGTGQATETRNMVNKGATVPCWLCDGAGKTDATFRDSLIDNAREVCDVLTRLNVADDPRLEDFREQAAKLATVAPDTLRELSHVREQTADRAQSILDAMVATYGKGVLVG
jgi:hypothetical protein